MARRFSQTLFVTGMQRSGTSLLDRLLSGHPALSILSQPFPLVFVEAKRDFLRGLGHEDEPYPLGPLFLEDRFTPDDFTRSLGSRRFDVATLARVFAEMATFSGQYSRPRPDVLARALADLEPADFHGTVSQLYRTLSPKPGARLFGGKETMCEEFLPHLLDRGARAVVIVRDPRDVYASLHYGRGPEFGGLPKPALFVARHWRKSVAFALHLETRRGFTWLRYEDLVQHPVPQLNAVAAKLGLDGFTAAGIEAALADGAEGGWPGNSSHTRHRGVAGDSVGRYRTLLPPEVSAYIEAVCYPEFRYLGYPVSTERPDLAASLRDFAELHAIERKGLRGYSVAPAHRQAELRRVELLAEEPTPSTRAYFLFDDVRARLRRTVGTP